MLNNAAPIEILRTVLTLVGTAISLGLFLHVWDRHATVARWVQEGRIKLWGPRHTFAVGFLVSVMFLLAIWVLLFATGINAMVNPAPTTPIAEASGYRGNLLILGVVILLLGFTGVMTAAWVAVGRPTVMPDSAPNSPISMMFRAIDYARDMGHSVNDNTQGAVGVLELLLEDPTVSQDRKELIRPALDALLRTREHVHNVHEAAKAMGH